MQPAATATELVSLIVKSGLIPPGELAAYVSTLSNADAMSPKELAARLQRDGLLTPFQAQHLLRGRYKNFFISKYKVLGALGTGGMSQVFLGEHIVMKHRVALKLLPFKDNADPDAVGRFLREARAAAAVNHPNVVRAHDVGKADGKLHYLVMDFVDGVNLHDLVKRLGPLPPEQAANYIAQAAAGLQEIASKGLFHRDLKPSNLLLDREGVIRILDLGLACFADEAPAAASQIDGSEAVFGTADYLAPEQAINPAGIDARADIYSLGATLYYLLAGRPPFETASTAQKLLAHQFTEPEAIENVPKELHAVLLKMMAKKPEDRYQNAFDVVEALAPWASLPLPLPPEDFFPAESANSGPRSAPSTASLGKTAASGRVVRFPKPNPTSDILRSGRIAAEPKTEKKRTWIYVAISAALLAIIISVIYFAFV